MWLQKKSRKIPLQDLHGCPPGSWSTVIPPVLSVLAPAWGRGPLWEDLGPRCGLLGHGFGEVVIFPEQSMEVLQGQTFKKGRKILEGSKAGLLLRTPAHPRMHPRLWETNPIALSADTLPERAIVDMRKLCLLPPGHQWTYSMGLCLPVQAGRSPL